MKRGLQRTKRSRRWVQVEPLEPRIVLSADGVLWGIDARLTLSFAPDGTMVDGQSSQLFAQMNSVGATNDWQDAILTAFQNWAQHTNSDIGLVSDDGADFGVAGATHNDPRFGDVRVGSIPLGDDLLAVSVSFDELIDGTWAGELLFNSEADIQSIDEVLRIAAHEAGNIFGLEDSADPASPLYDAAIPTASTPTPTDIVNLQAMFGARVGDIFDVDSFDVGELGFVLLPSFDAGSDIDASAPTVVFADISSHGDTDTFEHAVEADYSGNMTVQVVTSEISQLAPSLVVRDQTGALLGSADSQGNGGVDLAISFTVNGSTTDLVLELSADADNSSGVGGYSLVIQYDELNEVPVESLDRLVHESLRLVEIDDLEEYFKDGEQLFVNDDAGEDDLPGNEQILETAPGFVDGTRFQTAASIEMVGDIDRYSVTSPSNLPSTAEAAVVGLRSHEIGQFQGDLQVFDAAGNIVPHSIVVHNDYQLLLQLTDVAADETFVIEVAAAADSPEAVGGYELVAQFGTTPVERQTFISGSLERVFARPAHSLRVDRPQLFQFGFQAASDAPTDVSLRLTIRNAAGDVVALIDTTVGQTRTMAVLLDAGNYSIRVKTTQLNGDWAPVDYTLVGAALDDPLGPGLNDTTDDPFHFDEEGPRKFFIVTVLPF